jgi:phosphoglycolate phosphatase
MTEPPVVLKIAGHELLCRALAFDKDGTLTDREALWWGQFEKRSALLRQAYDESIVLRWAEDIGVDLDRHTIDPSGPLATGSPQQEVVILAVCLYRAGEMAWDTCLAHASRLIVEAEEALDPDQMAKALPGAASKIMELVEADVPLALVTMDSRSGTERALAHLGLTDAFGCIVTPLDVQREKPAPDMLRLAAHKLGVDPADILMVGDSEADLQMARDAGARSILVLHDHSTAPPEDPAVVAIRSLQEIVIEPRPDR